MPENFNVLEVSPSWDWESVRSRYPSKSIVPGLDSLYLNSALCAARLPLLQKWLDGDPLDISVWCEKMMSIFIRDMCLKALLKDFVRDWSLFALYLKEEWSKVMGGIKYNRIALLLMPLLFCFAVVLVLSCLSCGRQDKNKGKTKIKETVLARRMTAWVIMCPKMARLYSKPSGCHVTGAESLKKG